jgi:hypothetical protein
MSTNLRRSPRIQAKNNPISEPPSSKPPKNKKETSNTSEKPLSKPKKQKQSVSTSPSITISTPEKQKQSIENVKEISYKSQEETSISIYLLFLYLFIICMYCLFSNNKHGNKSQNNLETLGYILFIVFEIILFFFILWKIFSSFTKEGNDKSVLTKGFNVVEYIEVVTNSINLNIFGKYTSSIYSTVLFTSIIVFFTALIYMSVNKPTNGIGFQLFIMFFVLFLCLVSAIFYNRLTIPIIAILIIGMVLNGITSLMTASTLINIPKSEKSQGALDISPIAKDRLNQYKVISITNIFALFGLVTILFTRKFKMNKDEISPNLYKYNNGIVILLSIILVILSIYNIYNGTNLIYSIQNSQVIR